MRPPIEDRRDGRAGCVLTTAACVEPSRWWLPALIVAALAVRVALTDVFVGWDDLAYWESARALLNGDVSPTSIYRVRYGVTVPLAAAQALLGPSTIAAASVPLLYSTLSLLLAYGLGVLYGGRTLGLVAAALLAAIPIETVDATDLHTDVALGMFWAATMYFVMRGEREAPRRRPWFALAGLCLGLACLTKEIGPALVGVLVLRVVVLGSRSRQWAVLSVAALAVVLVDMAWLGRLSGHPLLRYMPPQHFAEARNIPPSYAWMLTYPSWFLNPFDPYFTALAGLFYLVLAGTVCGLRRRDRAVVELVWWWAPLFALFNFAPLDMTFAWPLFWRYPRTLHPLLIPFCLTAAWWLYHGLRGKAIARAAVVIVFGASAVLATWMLHFDRTRWSSVAHRASAVIERYPRETIIATDWRGAWLLQALLPDRRDRIVVYQAPLLAMPPVRMLVLYDPARATARGEQTPALVLSPPTSWHEIARFEMPVRGSVRRAVARALGWNDWPLRSAARDHVAPAALWEVPGSSGSR